MQVHRPLLWGRGWLTRLEGAWRIAILVHYTHVSMYVCMYASLVWKQTFPAGVRGVSACVFGVSWRSRALQLAVYTD